MTQPWSQVGDFRKFRCEGGRPGVERVVWSHRHFQGGSLSLSFQRHHCCYDSLLIVGSGRTCSKDTGSEGDTLGE